MAVRDAETALALLGAVRSGLLAIDARGRVTALSPEGARILGLGDPAQEIGRPAEAVLARHERLRALLAEGLQGAEHPSRAEVALATEGVEPRTLGFTLSVVRDEGGAIQGAALWFRDLTSFERKDEQERLQGRLAALGHMAAGLAHELRNPLASIELLAGLAKRKLAGDADACALIEELQAEVRSMAEIVRASLDFVRPASPSRRQVAVREALCEALRQARARVAFDGAVSLECDASLRACVDPEHLRRILVNLIGNACEAMVEAPPRAARRLQVGACAEAGALALVVADSGPGVAPELRERIFYPFFTTRAEGSGVGLAEVQKLAAAHGGTVRVDDAPGGGARFHVHLPGAVS